MLVRSLGRAVGAVGVVGRRGLPRGYRGLMGLMSEQPLLISSLIDHAARWHPDGEIVSRRIEAPDGELHRYTYVEARGRMMQLANALVRLGVAQGDRIATLAFSSFRHYELYFAVPGIGAVCHTVNPRLHPEQLAFILNDAEDTSVFVDLPLVPILLKALEAHACPHLQRVVVLTTPMRMPPAETLEALATAHAAQRREVLCYETMLQVESSEGTWRTDLDERTASSMCYTSGTTVMSCHV